MRDGERSSASAAERLAASVRETAQIEQRLDEANRSRDPGALQEALEAACAHPCAAHTWYLPELLADLAQARARAGDHDGAIEAKERAIAAGARGDPDPRADIGSFHLMAGRREEAEAIYTELRDRDPDDIWLYNHVGMDYADVGDHPTAVRWFEGGLEVAMRDGDPEKIVEQLADLRARSLEALGRDPDDLTRRARRFVESWEPPPREPFTVSVGTKPSVAEPRIEPCAYCGWSEEIPDTVLDEAEERLRFGEPPARGPRMELVIAWLPRDAFARALERWPELREGWEDGDHAAYSARIEEGLRELRSSAAHPVRVAPVRDLDDLVAFCAKTGDEPASGGGRAAYAAELLRTGETIPWPPGRNDPCWCGSGTKYKRCCGRS